MVKRDNEVHGKEISVETIVTNEYIQNTALSGTISKIEYNRIRSAVETNFLKNCTDVRFISNWQMEKKRV